MRSGFSLSRGIAAISMLLGIGSAISATGRDMFIEAEPSKPKKLVRDYSNWGRRGATYSGHGDRERRRHAGWPDGLMHRETPNLRSNANKRAQAIVIAAKPPRKPRARKAAAAA